MLNRVELSVDVAVPMDDLVDWCRSTDARKCFPGARNVTGDGGSIRFEVAIRAPGAAPATVTVDEYLKDFRREPGGLWFETSQVWTWPGRQCGTAWHRYRFVPSRRVTTLEFTWRYILPGLAGAQVSNAMHFARSIEKAAEIYIGQLAREAEGRQPVPTRFPRVPLRRKGTAAWPPLPPRPSAATRSWPS